MRLFTPSIAKLAGIDMGKKTDAQTDLTIRPDEPLQRSLFGEILDWMLVPLLLLWPLSIAITYVIAKSIANQPFDNALEDKVNVLAQQLAMRDSKLIVSLPISSRDILHADKIDSLYFNVLNLQGDLVDGDRDIPLPAEEEKPPFWSVQFRYDTIRNTEVRVAYMYVDLQITPHRLASNATTGNLALIQVAETLDKRVQLANQIVKGVILPEFIILPLALALVWFALSRGFSPLTELQERIGKRRPGDLSPIDSGQVPEEISPLVQSLNEMLYRLAQNIDMQKRFIADAAHQMKTPLAGMRMQSELALRQDDQEEIHRSLLQLARSSETATRLVNQLLALARAENQTPEANSFVSLELTELARNVVRDWVQTSFLYEIDFGFESSGQSLMILGNPTMLREMLSNLIDNALRYTPAQGSVTVRLRTDEEMRLAILEVEDTGPGIPAMERNHVFERFYRILGSHVEGSGLGLAIVREIALQHDAEIDIFNNPRSHNPKFPGSLFRIALRLQSEQSFAKEGS